MKIFSPGVRLRNGWWWNDGGRIDRAVEAIRRPGRRTLPARDLAGRSSRGKNCLIGPSPAKPRPDDPLSPPSPPRSCLGSVSLSLSLCLSPSPSLSLFTLRPSPSPTHDPITATEIDTRLSSRESHFLFIVLLLAFTYFFYLLFFFSSSLYIPFYYIFFPRIPHHLTSFNRSLAYLSIFLCIFPFFFPFSLRFFLRSCIDLPLPPCSTTLPPLIHHHRGNPTADEISLLRPAVPVINPHHFHPQYRILVPTSHFCE